MRNPKAELAALEARIERIVSSVHGFVTAAENDQLERLRAEVSDPSYIRTQFLALKADEAGR